MYKNIVVIGCNGAIGGAFISHLSQKYTEAIIHGFSRLSVKSKLKNVNIYSIDYLDETSIANAANIASKDGLIDLVIVATGVLHTDKIMPEKSMKELTIDKLKFLFEANTVTPALIAKYFIPKLNKNSKSVFAVLSARVGSISDNVLGGWYSYRASKAALNMLIKSFAIEARHANKNAIIVGLHPGTVKSKLSKPFQHNVPQNKLFEPEYSVACLTNVINQLTIENSGKLFAWDGKEITP